MKNLKRICLILQIFLMISISATGFARAGEPDVFWKGSASAQKEPFIKIVDTNEEWSELWRRAFEKPAPDVDFDRHVVACVFLGHRADWLYAISVADPVRTGEAWVVSYSLAQIVLELSGPFKASGQYVMKVLEKKKDAPMILEEDGQFGKRR